MQELQDVINRVGPLDVDAMAAATARQQRLTKPAGSLGRLEGLAIQIAGITRNPLPTVERKAVVVMAGDHGVTAQGVSAYPAEVTPQMVLNFVHGGAAINALARQAGARVVVVDVGVAAEVAHPAVIARKVAPGTADMAVGPAMSRELALAAIGVGLEVIAAEIERGLDLVAIGEMGIGNTTAASAITAAVTRTNVALVTGHGTGIDEAQRLRKVAVIERALAVNAPDSADPLDVLAKVGGFEIAGLVGVILGAGAARIPVVVDGFITGAAALIAAELCPAITAYFIAAHTSVERGHRVILERLDLAPLLDLQLRLGEGTGAALAMPIIEAALRAHREMATFDEAGVSERSEAADAVDAT
jgi:nicotinate-nucleotide--dimethylbenzimidazole phosphoribosyltransferase